jgi:oligopeptide/dipeptide ABC transporter ATP-binding protein
MDADTNQPEQPLLRVRDVTTHFSKGRRRGAPSGVLAVDRVSLDIAPGEVLGLVGESGCGKSTLARTLMGVLPHTAGTVTFDGVEMGRRASPARLGSMQMIFQDPWESLNPDRRVGPIVADGLAIQKLAPRSERRGLVRDALTAVGLPDDAESRFPHEFSGGQRQRIGIARALVMKPRLIIADEPVSALDVSVQAQVINLMVELRERLGLAYLFISHDIAVVSYFSDRIAVMYLGRIVEEAATRTLLNKPQHPYTVGLLASAPMGTSGRGVRRHGIAGELPDPAHRPSGCVFRTRCPIAQAICEVEEPPMVRSHGANVACHFPGSLSSAGARKDIPT